MCLYASQIFSSHLMFRHGTNYERANHTRQSAHTVRDTHQDTSISWCNVKVIDIETLRKKIIIQISTHPLNIHHVLRNKLYFTWNGKTRETHSQNQECNGNTFCVWEAHHQQQCGLHPKPWSTRAPRTLLYCISKQDTYLTERFVLTRFSQLRSVSKRHALHASPFHNFSVQLKYSSQSFCFTVSHLLFWCTNVFSL